MAQASSLLKEIWGEGAKQAGSLRYNTRGDAEGLPASPPDRSPGYEKNSREARRESRSGAARRRAGYRKTRFPFNEPVNMLISSYLAEESGYRKTRFRTKDPGNMLISSHLEDESGIPEKSIFVERTRQCVEIWALKKRPQL